MKETVREGGNLHHKEFEALMQRVEQMELKGQKKRWKFENIGASTGDSGTGKATKDTYDKICDVEAVTEEKMQDFIESVPKYNGRIMFE